MMKKYRHILYVLTTLCLLVSLTSVVLAANASMIIDNETISYITIEGTADSITPDNNSYQIMAADERYSAGLFKYRYRARTRTVEFTNNHPGWVKIDYTIDENGTLTAGTNCEIADGVIHLKGQGSTFQIAVTSSTNTESKSQATKTCTFSPTEIEKETLMPTITFATGANGTYTVKDAAGNSVNIGGSANSESYTLTPGTADPGYKFLCFVFTPDDTTAAKSSFGLNATGAVTFGDLTVPGTVSCTFMPTDSAMYTVDGVYYAYLDEAITAAKGGGSKKIVLVGSGKVCGSTGQSEFTIPSGVTMVLPYASGQAFVQGSSLSSNDYFPHGNYGDGNGSSYQTKPGSLTSGKYLELTIPSGTTVKNNGIIAVGGTLYGNSTMSGAHSNLKVDGILELKSNTSVLSAIGYVYGNGSVVANGAGATILQPFSMLRPYSWDWSVANTGRSMSDGVGMQTWPSDGYNGNNPSPRYSTQAIQCDFQMAYGDTMYGYADQYCNNHYRCTVALVGSVDQSVIKLNRNATLTSSYNADIKSSTYDTVGKLTLTISGGATQGAIRLSQSGFTLDLTKWPFPVPYNYDIVLTNGTYTMSLDTTLLPGAGLTIGSDATLNLSSGKYLAVFTGADDHSIFNGASLENSRLVLVGLATREWPTQTTTYGTYKTGRYPANSTLSGPSGGTMMANLVVDGTLNIPEGAHFGGVVQTNGSGTIIMNGSTDRFTRQLGLTGKCNDMDHWSFAFAGATVYEFYPQYFDAAGELKEMKSGNIYYGVNNTSNQDGISEFSYVLYTNSDNFEGDYREAHTKTIDATAVGQWSTIPTVQALNGNGEFVKGYGTLQAAISDYPNITADKPYLQINLASPVVVHDSNRYVLSGNSDAELKSDVYLDLNGCNITGNITRDAKTTHTLYGFDSGTNAYTAGGSITGTVAACSGTAPLDRGPNADKNYIAVNDGNVYTFPRASVSVTGIQFYKSDGNYYAIFRGNYKSALNASTVGFVFNGNAATSISESETNFSFENDFPFYYGRGIDSSLTSVSATATVNNIGITSLERSLSRILAEFDAYKGEET